jgi:CHASE1-domain containing sensor protein
MIAIRPGRMVTISSALANYENALQAARSLWLASDSVSRPEFNAFARSLDLPKRYPGLQGIGSSGPAVPSPGRRSSPSGDRTFVLRYAPLAGNRS